MFNMSVDITRTMKPDQNVFFIINQGEFTEKKLKKLNEIKSSTTGSMRSLLDKTPEYTPKSKKIPSNHCSSFSLKHDPNIREKSKKLKIATDIGKIRNSSEYAGKRLNQFDNVESFYLNTK